MKPKATPSVGRTVGLETKKKKNAVPFWLVFFFIAVPLVLFTILTIGDLARKPVEKPIKWEKIVVERNHPTTTATPKRYIPSLYVTKRGYPASPSKELVERFIRYTVQDDTRAAAKLVANGTVILLKGDLEVHLMDTEIFDGMVRIRPKGSTLELWTVNEAIEEK